MLAEHVICICHTDEIINYYYHKQAMVALTCTFWYSKFCATDFLVFATVVLVLHTQRGLVDVSFLGFISIVRY